MHRYFRQYLKILTMAFALTVLAGMSSSATACPNCKFANETESNRPRAYMYSILFMIGMPATIFTGFGISFYRMTKKAQQAALEGTEESSAEAGSDEFSG
ncbi:MAG: hypothetical protein RIK87_03120 [Fuerstiella sp.]